jgi:hypothetical protein
MNRKRKNRKKNDNAIESENVFQNEEKMEEEEEKEKSPRKSKETEIKTPQKANVDPQSLTIAELKNALRIAGVQTPVAKAPKADLVKLYKEKILSE